MKEDCSFEKCLQSQSSLAGAMITEDLHGTWFLAKKSGKRIDKEGIKTIQAWYHRETIWTG
jgi:hypothetical protein